MTVTFIKNRSKGGKKREDREKEHEVMRVEVVREMLKPKMVIKTSALQNL